MLHHMIEEAALQNVMEAIGWGVKLRPLDKANLSMRYLEKTDEQMIPWIKIDMETKLDSSLSMSISEMSQRAMELAAALWINNLNEFKNDTITSPASDSEEQTWDWES